jgi:hypothetical protein
MLSLTDFSQSPCLQLTYRNVSYRIRRDFSCIHTNFFKFQYLTTSNQKVNTHNELLPCCLTYMLKRISSNITFYEVLCYNTQSEHPTTAAGLVSIPI